jgi:hypothetical protein
VRARSTRYPTGARWMPDQEDGPQRPVSATSKHTTIVPDESSECRPRSRFLGKSTSPSEIENSRWPCIFSSDGAEYTAQDLLAFLRAFSDPGGDESRKMGGGLPNNVCEIIRLQEYFDGMGTAQEMGKRFKTSEPNKT